MSTFRLRASPAILAVATIPLWLSLMDTTILNVAYPNIIASLGATLDEVSWASTAYTLAGIAMLPLTGWLVARFGRKRVFLFIVTVFTAGSALCAFSTSAMELGAFRLLQGIGGGLLGSIGQAIFVDAYPDEDRTDALNLLSVAVMVGPIAGPIIAGLVLEHGGWPLLFLINVPLGAFTLWLGSRLDLDQKQPRPAAAFSPVTIAVLFGSIFCLQFVIQSGERLGWFDSDAIRWSLFAGIVAFAWLVNQQMKLRRPMIDFRLFARNREFLVGNILVVIAGASNYGIAFLGPLYLQDILRFSPLQTALFTLPGVVAMFVGNRIQATACRRISVYAVVSFGLVALGAALWYNGVYRDLSSVTAVTWLRALQGFAFGIFMIPIGILSLKTVKRSELDSASGLSALVRQESGMIGIALIAAMIERYQTTFFDRLLAQTPRWPLELQRAQLSSPAMMQRVLWRADVMAYQHVFAVCAIVTIVCGICVAAYGVAEWLSRQAERAAPAIEPA